MALSQNVTVFVRPWNSHKMEPGHLIQNLSRSHRPEPVSEAAGFPVRTSPKALRKQDRRGQALPPTFRLAHWPGRRREQDLTAAILKNLFAFPDAPVPERFQC